MKKMIELEDRWKAYRYRAIIFYLFIVVFIAFIIILGVFIKYQYDKMTAKSSTKAAQTHIAQIQNPNVNVKQTGQPNESNNILNQAAVDDGNKYSNKIYFICKKVITNKLTVRENPSFSSKALGYYPIDSIFCAENENVNGLMKTTNGWVSASDKYSEVVEVNMFVDTGFYKYQNSSTKIAKTPAKQTSFEEVRVFDKPQSINQPSMDIAANTVQNANFQTQSQNLNQSQNIQKEIIQPKKTIEINTQKITKEVGIELKKSDYRHSNDYDTAMEVANYYYENKDYANSIQWALNASNADSKGKQKVESWIIYAKSLYASGKQQQAIEVLDRYVSSTNSKDAIDVLNNMKRGII
ncbi:MAG: CDC27 family protein [Helicobacteraceae bacterium]|nr:CDC27 family protein [Helicobacteraceae bacterium]